MYTPTASPCQRILEMRPKCSHSDYLGIQSRDEISERAKHSIRRVDMSPIIQKKWQLSLAPSGSDSKSQIPLRLQTGDAVEGSFYVFDNRKVKFEVKGPRGHKLVSGVDAETYVFRFAAQQDGIHYLRFEYSCFLGEEYASVVCRCRLPRREFPKDLVAYDKTSEKQDNCYIVTASLGHKAHSELDRIRSFRDRTIGNSTAGQKLMSFYRHIAPPVASLVSESPAVRSSLLYLFIIPSLCLLRQTYKFPFTSRCRDSVVLGILCLALIWGTVLFAGHSLLSLTVDVLQNKVARLKEKRTTPDLPLGNRSR